MIDERYNIGRPLSALSLQQTYGRVEPVGNATHPKPMRWSACKCCEQPKKPEEDYCSTRCQDQHEAHLCRCGWN
jgi:hypothetical protein